MVVVIDIVVAEHQAAPGEGAGIKAEGQVEIERPHVPLSGDIISECAQNKENVDRDAQHLYNSNSLNSTFKCNYKLSSKNKGHEISSCQWSDTSLRWGSPRP